MSRFEDLQPNAAVRGILPDALVTVLPAQQAVYPSDPLFLVTKLITSEEQSFLAELDKKFWNTADRRRSNVDAAGMCLSNIRSLAC